MVKSEVKGRYSTDVVVSNVWHNMLGDYRAFYGETTFVKNVESAFDSGLKTYREFEYPTLGILPPFEYKLRCQLENVIKKYKFANDLYSEDELRKRTIEKYFDEQLRILQPRPRRFTTHLVLQRARKIAASILGEYDESEVFESCKFGRKSSIGCPLNLAYLDIKLSEVAAFTGSASCSRIFYDRIITDDRILSEIVSNIEAKPENLRHESLNLICVPKNWKTHRLITPLTLLSLFYSNGLGTVVTQRLKEAKLDISKLQHRHQAYVRRFSADLSHATADLSSASDSITVELLNAILPRAWFVALKPLFCHTVLFKDDSNCVVPAWTASVLPMGNGVTFPVETLVFYCLIKAMGTLTGIHGVYSVYGDDLIYPSLLHRYVPRVFQNLGLCMNMDKTFVHFPFRESCGSDFYRGIDVRSFYFDGTSTNLGRSKYAAFLHKTINGLRRRWSHDELPKTFSYLFLELGKLGPICRVPPLYPDEAGIKVAYPSDIPFDTPLVTYEPIIREYYGSGNVKYEFKCYEYVTERRIVKVILPYYWLALQGLTDDIDENQSYCNPEPFSLRSSLAWTKQCHTRYYTLPDGRKKKKILKRFVPTVSSRVGGKHKMGHGSTLSWI